MSLAIKHQGVAKERTSEGLVTSVSYNGTKAECETAIASASIGSYTAGYGRLSSASIEQDAGSLWRFTERFIMSDTTDTTNVSEPDTSFGTFSASLDVSMMSNPLESHPNYRTCWNYFLAARDDAGTTAPVWWAEAVDPLLTAERGEKYRWMQTASELPIGSDADGRTWRLLKYPVKPCVTCYDSVCYTQTETARFTSYTLACEAVSAKVNKIGTPTVANEMTGGTWKCDRASIRFSGAWLATLTWTRSADASGWDTDLYDEIPSSEEST